MSDDDPTLPLAKAPWLIKARGTGHSASSSRIEANESDRQDLAEALGILACQRLTVDYRLKPAGRDRFKAVGHISADLVQACVATLEPVPEKIEEHFSIDFWPAEEIDEELPDGEIHLDEEAPEPIEHGEIALGRLVYELIAVAMEPFPRSPNAPASDGSEPIATSGQKPESPFASLAKLKKPG
jgi:uncharacterized metal-binding protein YceD (DUF177 family)